MYIPIPATHIAEFLSALTFPYCEVHIIVTLSCTVLLFQNITTGIKSSLCDAWAAVAVSITIFFAIVPLANEVFAAYTGKR